MKNLLLPSLTLLLTACVNFDELGRNARCDAGLCDAGVTPTVDAGPLELVVIWSRTQQLPPDEFVPRPGAVAAGLNDRVLLFREVSFTAATNELPRGFISGDVIALETTTGRVLKEDGSFSANSAEARRTIVPGRRFSLTSREPVVTLTIGERLDDGGLPLQPDGGPHLLNDGGVFNWAVGDVMLVVEQSTIGFNAFPTPPSTAIAASAFFEPDGGIFGGYVTPIGINSTLATITVDGYSFSNDQVRECAAPAIDSVMTIGVLRNQPDERLVTLSECSANTLTVASYSPRVLVKSTKLTISAGASNGRMAIAPESTRGRQPFVAYRKSAANSFHLSRLDETGTTEQFTRQLTETAAGPTRVAALAVDANNHPLVVFATRTIQFIGQPPVTSTTGLVLASFDENLELRWAAPLKGPDPVVCNSATFAQGQLVLEMQCPGATNGTPNPGGFCTRELWSVAVKVALPDGGLP